MLNKEDNILNYNVELCEESNKYLLVSNIEKFEKYIIDEELAYALGDIIDVEISNNHKIKDKYKEMIRTKNTMNYKKTFKSLSILTASSLILSISLLLSLSSPLIALIILSTVMSSAKLIVDTSNLINDKITSNKKLMFEIKEITKELKKLYELKTIILSAKKDIRLEKEKDSYDSKNTSHKYILTNDIVEFVKKEQFKR